MMFVVTLLIPLVFICQPYSYSRMHSHTAEGHILAKALLFLLSPPCCSLPFPQHYGSHHYSDRT